MSSIHSPSKTLQKKSRAYCPKIAFGDIKSSNIKIISRSTGGHVEKMQIGNGLIEGRTVREALELPSTNFTIKISAGKITFTSSGSGHGVGMSQYGASGMAKKAMTIRTSWRITTRGRRCGEEVNQKFL